MRLDGERSYLLEKANVRAISLIICLLSQNSLSRMNKGFDGICFIEHIDAHDNTVPSRIRPRLS
jgi:hypothetical protein